VFARTEIISSAKISVFASAFPLVPNREKLSTLVAFPHGE